MAVLRRVWMCVLAVGVAFVSASVAGAFTIPPSPIVDGTEGEVRLLWTEPVDPADVGKTCDVVLVMANNESTREGSDLIFESGGATVVAENVEHEMSLRTVVGQLTLGATITVSVRLGPEGMYSGGSDVETICPPTGVPSSTVVGAAPVPAAATSAQPRFTG